MAHKSIHPDEELYQQDRDFAGIAALSNVLPPVITSCDKCMFSEMGCAQCGAPRQTRPVIGIQSLSAIWLESYQKFCTVDMDDDTTRVERAEAAAQKEVHNFLFRFLSGEQQRREVFNAIAYCKLRECRMAAGVLTIDDQAMYLLTNSDSRFDSNVRHGWKTSLLNNLCHLRLALGDRELTDQRRELYTTRMVELVRHVREHSPWMRNQEKLYVSTASLLVINNDAFGLRFGTDQEKKSFLLHMGNAPKIMFDKVVTAHVLDLSWEVCNTMDELKTKKYMGKKRGDGLQSRTWYTMLDKVILGNAWPTPSFTAFVHRIVKNYISMQCPCDDAAKPCHVVRKCDELRYWNGNEDQNELIKGAFDGVKSIVGKLKNRADNSNVYAAIVTANKGAPSYAVHYLARLLGEPGASFEAMVRKGSKQALKYGACDNNGISKQYLDMVAQIDNAAIGMEMEKNFGDELARHLPAPVHAAAEVAGFLTKTYFFRNLLERLVCSPTHQGHVFVKPKVVETVELVQGTLNAARIIASKRRPSHLVGQNGGILRSVWSNPVSKKTLGRITKLGMFTRKRHQMPKLLQNYLTEQDAAKSGALLGAMRALLYVLRGHQNPRDETEWVEGIDLQLWDSTDGLSIVDPTKPWLHRSALKQRVILLDAHKFFKSFLYDYAPGSHTDRTTCRIYLIEIVDIEDDVYDMLKYVRAMIKAYASLHQLIVPCVITYTEKLVNAAKDLERALLGFNQASQVPACMQAVSVRTVPCDRKESTEQQKGAKAQWKSNWLRDKRTVACKKDIYLTRDMDTESRLSEQNEQRLSKQFKRYKKQYPSTEAAESLETYKTAQRVIESDLPFTASRLPTESDRRKQFAELWAADCQRRLTSITMNALKLTNNLAKKEQMRDTYLSGARKIDEGVRTDIDEFLRHDPNIHPSTDMWKEYSAQSLQRTGGAGRLHAQMRNAATNGRHNESKLAPEMGTRARLRIHQVWTEGTAAGRAAARNKLFDSLIGYCKERDALRDAETAAHQANLVYQAGLAMRNRRPIPSNEGHNDTSETQDASTAKKPKSVPVHQRYKNLKSSAAQQLAEARENGFQTMHYGKRKIGPAGVGAHTSMMGAYYEATQGMPEDQKLTLMPYTMRRKGRMLPKARKKAKASSAPNVSKRARGRRRIATSDSDMSDGEVADGGLNEEEHEAFSDFDNESNEEDAVQHEEEDGGDDSDADNGE